VKLKLARCTLRPWRVGDEASLVRNANNRRVWRNLSRLPHPYTTGDADAWIGRASPQSPVTDFAIVVDGDAVGGIGVEIGRDVFYRSAEIGYWLGEPYWGRGIASEALRAMTEYAFVTFDLCRLQAGVFEWNPASMRVLEKAGYTLEARHRKNVTKDGETIDRLVYALVRPVKSDA
jgi:ribosomal-protein-alanine N-acetyltransferase